ncbi:hypothetical protein ACFO3I_08260 [Rheinheimera marina]|uniref:Flagellar protein FlhE n=1 Tax=Rheinheimera marina TaxID=1774958 RepID=A0ABV9JLD0_9GAMM
MRAGRTSVFCLLMLLPAVAAAAPRDLVWNVEKTLIAGADVVIPYDAKWPKQSADIVAFGATGQVPAGVNCKLELLVQQDLLLSLPCTNLYKLPKPVRLVPAMRVQLRLYNAAFPSAGVKIELRNRLILDVPQA